MHGNMEHPASQGQAHSETYKQTDNKGCFGIISPSRRYVKAKSRTNTGPLRWSCQHKWVDLADSYLQPHDQRQVLVLRRLAVSIVEPPEHVGPVSHFHIAPGFFTRQGTGEPCVGFNYTRCFNLVFSFRVTYKLNTNELYHYCGKEVSKITAPINHVTGAFVLQWAESRRGITLIQINIGLLVSEFSRLENITF